MNEKDPSVPYGENRADTPTEHRGNADEAARVDQTGVLGEIADEAAGPSVWLPVPAPPDQLAPTVYLDDPRAVLVSAPIVPLHAEGQAGGDRLFDYELVEEIASGGMGVVYRARQVSLNRLVAVKFLRAGRLATLAERQRFRVEAATAARLDHPNIVPVYEVGEYAGTCYLSMKLLKGGSLAAAVAQGRWQAPGRETACAVAELMRTVARAIHFVHQHGIIHRDLKPANILLDGEGRPYVSDFGLAQHPPGEHGDTFLPGVVGTPAYMAPEQALGPLHGVTTAADIYGLGAILYEMLTGRPPFQGRSVRHTLAQLSSEEPPLPRYYRPEVSRTLEAICRKAMRREPQRRHASAADLAADFDRFLDHAPKTVVAPLKPPVWPERKPEETNSTEIYWAAGASEK